MTPLRWLLGMSVLAGLACREPFAPADFAGAYGWSGTRTVLVSDRDTLWVLADTFELRADRSGVWRTSVMRSSGIRRPEVVHQEWPLNFRARGRAVGIVPTCPMNTDCDAVGYARAWYDVHGAEALVSRDQPHLVYARLSGVQ